MEIKETLKIFFIFIIGTDCVYAYETPTHEKITRTVFENTVLFKTDGILVDLGLKIPKNLYDPYVDLFFDEYLDNYFRPKIKDNKKNVKYHISFGSNYEDSNRIAWACSHFFDPANDRPLTGNLLLEQYCSYDYQNTSPDWALEDQHRLALRDDSLMDDGLERYKLALTLNKESRRSENFGAFFRNLGQAIHHVQDMATPEHVRNDVHIPVGRSASLYEMYTNCKYGVKNPTIDPSWFVQGVINLLTSSIACLDEDQAIKMDDQKYQELSLKDFRTARSFWVNDGKGLAEFTNSNFVSQDTNFRMAWYYPNNVIPVTHRDYRLPSLGNTIDYFEVSEDIAELMPETSLSGEVWFIKTNVMDHVTGVTSVNTRASTYSSFAADLERYTFLPSSTLRTFTLNRFNFDAAHDYLLPRAVSYSAGLINYFFRGRIEVNNVQYTAGNSVTLTVKNVTSEKNPGNAPYTFIDGTFTLYYDDEVGNRNASGVHAVSSEFADKDEITLTFPLPSYQSLIDTDRPLTLVYHGQIGAPDQTSSEWEYGIAAKVFYPNPLMAFNVEGYAGGAPIPNIINTYRSFDLGTSWEKMTPFPIPVANDTGSQIRVENAIYSGEDNGVLFYATYTDYDPFPTITRFLVSTVTKDKGLTWEGLSTDWNFLHEGTENVAEGSFVLDSITYTGNADDPSQLSAIRVKHPAPDAPLPAPRTFQLVKSSDWGSPGSWSQTGIFIPGGLPELDYLGDDEYTFSVYVEESESANPDTLQFDSALRRTDDAGASYYDLTRFAMECTQEDAMCIQHLVGTGGYFGNKRMLGWADRHYASYNSENPSNQIPLYLSEDGGLSWKPFGKKGVAPMSEECEGVSENRHVKVENIIYNGSYKIKDSTTGEESDQHVLFLETDCYRIIEDANNQFKEAVFIDKTYFSTVNSGMAWIQANAPPGPPESLIIYAGDNGAIPWLYQ